MTKIPPPSPPTDFDEDSFAGGIASTWHDALEWAERGDHEHLASLLRSDLSLNDDSFVREFLASMLLKSPRPRGRPARRPVKNWAIDAKGQVAMVEIPKKAAIPVFEVRQWVRENRAKHGKRVTEAAAKKFNLSVVSIENAVRRSAKGFKPRSK